MIRSISGSYPFHQLLLVFDLLHGSAMSATRRVFIVGGTGVQGIPVIRGLVGDCAYKARVLTRDTTSIRAKQLLLSSNVELVEGSFASEEDLRKGFNGCDYAFVNIDGFNSGEKTEMFWAIRAYEIALEENVKFFIYGNLDYGYKKSGYHPDCRCGHYDGKGRIGDWILQQNVDNSVRMGAALFTTGPYMEMTIAQGTPMSPVIEDGVVVWRVPLGSGSVPHVALSDCAHYVRWLFDHQEEANGMNLEVAIEHISYEHMAAAFERVTGHPARFVDVSLEEYWRSGPLSFMANSAAGYNSTRDDPATLSIQENFTGFWNMFKHLGVITRDYQLLDHIYPGRIHTAEEWFLREEVRGKQEGLGGLWDRVNNLKPILKIAEDGRKGSL